MEIQLSLHRVAILVLEFDSKYSKLTEQELEDTLEYDLWSYSNMLLIHDAIEDLYNLEKNIDVFVNITFNTEINIAFTENNSNDISLSRAKEMVKEFCLYLSDLYNGYKLYENGKLVYYPSIRNIDKSTCANSLLIEYIGNVDELTVEKLENLHDLIKGNI